MRSPEQILIDVLFEFAMRMYAGEYKFKDREEMAEYLRNQLRQLGFDVYAVGSSHASLR